MLWKAAIAKVLILSKGVRSKSQQKNRSRCLRNQMIINHISMTFSSLQSTFAQIVLFGTDNNLTKFVERWLMKHGTVNTDIHLHCLLELCKGTGKKGKQHKATGSKRAKRM